MEYEVVVPLAGFENEHTFVYEKIDNFFSSIKSESSGIELRMMNFDSLKNIDFDLPEWFIEQMGIKDVNDISVYFIFVLQSPATNSVVNLFAPVILNNKNYKMGQIQLKLDEVKLETLENILCG
jgi:flagellar assembly factor FliW